MSCLSAGTAVWTVSLADGGGGWVHGVFVSFDDALAKLRAYEAEEGGSVLGEPRPMDGDEPTYWIVPILNGITGDDDRFEICKHELGQCDP